MPPCLKSVSLAILLAIMGLSPLRGEQLYPDSPQSRTRCDFAMEMPKAYISGILLMVNEDGDTLKGSLVNEFGISFIDFSYQASKNKVKLHSVMKKLDKWYIKRMLQNDLKQLLSGMRNGETEYYNKRQKIRYTVAPASEVTQPDETETDTEIILLQ